MLNMVGLTVDQAVAIVKCICVCAVFASALIAWLYARRHWVYVRATLLWYL